jgi:hypothetical protein
MTSYQHCFNHSIVHAKSDRTLEAHSYFFDTQAAAGRKYERLIADLADIGISGANVRVEEYPTGESIVLFNCYVKGSRNTHTLEIELNEGDTVSVALRMMERLSRKYVR